MRLQDLLGPRSARAPGERKRARCPHVELLEGRAVPASYPVASVPDLIAAINAANLTSEADTITLAAGTTYLLTSPDNDTDGPTGLPAIVGTGGSLTIVGNGTVVERGTNNSGLRFFDVAAGGSLTLRDITLQGGLTRNAGGALFNRGTLTLDHVTIQNNRSGSGGGVYSVGDLIVEGSTIRGNSAIGDRGSDGHYFFFGIWIATPGMPGGPAYGGGVTIAGGTASISNSTLTDNLARGGDGGAGVNVNVDSTPLRSAGGDGGDGFGGGLYVAGGTVTLLNSEVIQNRAKGGLGGSGAKPLKGAPGEGIGGGLYIAPAAVVSLDAFTANRTKRNKASTADNDIYGSYVPIP